MSRHTADLLTCPSAGAGPATHPTQPTNPRQLADFLTCPPAGVGPATHPAHEPRQLADFLTGPSVAPVRQPVVSGAGVPGGQASERYSSA
jgi:hypothetical protein